MSFSNDNLTSNWPPAGPATYRRLHYGSGHEMLRRCWKYFLVLVLVLVLLMIVYEHAAIPATLRYVYISNNDLEGATRGDCLSSGFVTQSNAIQCTNEMFL